MANNNDQHKGYHRLAAVIAADNSGAIFRSFDYLNALSLLSLQAEITELQAHFQYQCSADDRSTDEDEKLYSQWFLKLRESKERSGDQYAMLETLRERLSEYSESASSLALSEGG